MMKNRNSCLPLWIILVSLTFILVSIPVQEVYAAAPTVIVAAGSQTLTDTTVRVCFDETNVDAGTVDDADFLVDLAAVTHVNNGVDAACGGDVSVTLTLVAGTFATGATPAVRLVDTSGITHGGLNIQNGEVNIVAADGLDPIFSGVLPTASSSINSVTAASDVSYTISEAIASGTIIITNTGGTAGGGGTCTLRGTALNTGAHNNFELTNTADTCTAAITLNDGGIYTFAFDGTDAATNTATTVSRTLVTFDTTAPTFTARTTSTTTTTTVTFDEAINGGNFVAGDWNVVGVAATGIAPSGAAGGETSIVLTHTTIGVDDSPSVQYTAGNLADSAGNVVVGNTVTAADGNPAREGGGSGSGSHTAPSFTTGFSEDELPFLLNGNEIDVSNFVNEVGVTTIKTGEATNLSLLLSDDDGVVYVGLYTNLRDSERQRHQSDTIIEWRNNEGLSVIDPHGYFEDASVIVSDKDNKKEFSFDITFANAMEKSDLIVYVWDIRRNSFQTSILDMWEVIDNPKPSHVTEPEITTDVSEPSKDTSESIPLINISVVLDNWAGYSESTSSDSEMLQSIGLEGEHIPSWVKKLGGWVHKGLIDDVDFINAIKNLYSRGLVY